MKKVLIVFVLLFVGFLLGQYFRLDRVFRKDYEERFKESSIEEKTERATTNPLTGYSIMALGGEIWIFDGEIERFIPNIPKRKVFLDPLSPTKGSYFYILDTTLHESMQILESSQILKVNLPIEEFDYAEIEKEKIRIKEGIKNIISLKSCSSDGSTIIAEVNLSAKDIDLALVKIDVETGNFEKIE